MASSFFSKLDELIASQSDDQADAASVITSLGVPSASIAILTTSGIISHTIANASSPADPDTLYQACSISKPICGLAVLRTIDEGRLALSDSITKHLPPAYIDAISTPPTRALLDHVTILHLLTHTAGTTVSSFPGYDPSCSIPNLTTILSGCTGANTPQIKLNRFPGLKWRYSGGGTTIIQAILETIHNKPLSEIVKQLVLEPLGMARSFYALPAGERNYAQCWSTGLTQTNPTRWHVQPELGAAGLWTTPIDLLKAARGIRDAAEGKSDFLSRDLALTGLQAVEGANEFAHGGWQRQQGWFGHSGGNQPGFTCQLMAVWDDDRRDGRLGEAEGEGIAIMTSSVMGTELCIRLLHAIAYLRNWPGREVVQVTPTGGLACPLSDAKVAVDQAWREWSGKWRVIVNEGDGSMRSSQVLEIFEDEERSPQVKFAELPALNLVKAAAASVSYGGKRGLIGIDLVVEGLSMMLALGYDNKGQKGLKIWPGFSEPMLDCERVGDS